MRKPKQHYGASLCQGTVAGTLVVVFVILVTCLHNIEVGAQQAWGDWQPPEWNPWIPPWNNFAPHVVVRTYYGDVQGITVPWHIDDEYWRNDWSHEPPVGEYPPWFMRRINCFLGVPYATPPIGKLRFTRPSPPRWGGVWDASYFRPACPQRLDDIRLDIPDFPIANVSEDCLYMNIFVPNKTNPDLSPDREIYPVVVFIHSGEFTHGTSQQVPGHVLATRDVVVVTFNYRLGVLGFLTTEDLHAQGNWGLFDQHLAIEFIKENIRAFRGDPDKITLMGDGAGAASVGFHILSPVTRGKDFYHQCIMMSGTDQSPFAFVDPFWRPRDYAMALAEDLGCPTFHSFDMMECLRDNTTKTWRAIIDAQYRVKAHDGALGKVWGPTVDGGYIGIAPVWSFLPITPADLRRVLPKDPAIGFNFVPCIIGIETQAGSKKANDSVRFASDGGLLRESFREFVLGLMKSWLIIDVYQERALDAIEFQYTYWPDPENRTARGQEFINMVTDIEFGQPMDTVVQQQAETENVFMYQFNYNSWNSWLPQWMGVGYSQALPYVLGYPFLNETVLNETEMIPRQWYDYEDRNMSNWMMYMWSNFIKYGDPTPNITRNLTWGPFNHYNLSYLKIDFHSHMWYRYRQTQYGFWAEYFPAYAKQDFFVPTATPTPAGFEYVVATGSLSILLIILLCGVGLLGYLMWYQSKEDDPGGQYIPPARKTYGGVQYGTDQRGRSDYGRSQYGRSKYEGAQYEGAQNAGAQNAGAQNTDADVPLSFLPNRTGSDDTGEEYMPPARKLYGGVQQEDGKAQYERAQYGGSKYGGAQYGGAHNDYGDMPLSFLPSRMGSQSTLGSKSTKSPSIAQHSVV